MNKTGRWMNTVKLFLMSCLLALATTGCSENITEIGDVALVTAMGIDYDVSKKNYLFTAYCVLPSATSSENTGKLMEWVVNARGGSILEAARNLQGRAGKMPIWQHNKFFIIGESAARHAFNEIVDTMTRNRQIRITSYIFVSEGQAADVLLMRTDTGDLLSNDLLGKKRNEKDFGKSFSQSIQDIANWNTNPYRGFITGKVSKVKLNHSGEELVLFGGAVFNKGKLADWVSGEDVLVEHFLSTKNKWKHLNIPVTFSFNNSKTTLFFNLAKQSIRVSDTKGKPEVYIQLDFKAIAGQLDRHLQVSNRETIAQLEQTAAQHMKSRVQHTVEHFQKDLKIDVIGISDIYYQHHPKSWAVLKSHWEEVYPQIPFHIAVNVRLDNLGMTQTLGGM
jgi:germination protein, Ger(x)C family